LPFVVRDVGPPELRIKFLCGYHLVTDARHNLSVGRSLTFAILAAPSQPKHYREEQQ
jgi:hypothetical protein